MLKYCPNKHQSQKCVINSCLNVLKFVFVWFVTFDVIRKLGSAVFFDGYTVFADLCSDLITFVSEEIGINSITLDNINLDDDNFHYFDSETISYVRIMVLYKKYKQRKINVNKKYIKNYYL